MGIYGNQFYETIRQGTISSAEALVPILMMELGITRDARVIDVGCGEAWWAQTFAEYGCEVLGLDGDWHGPDHPLGRRFIAHDLNRPVDHPSLRKQFDVVICLEVAEHLRPERAASFIADLCGLSNGGPIIFSAAIPGQGGTGHLNEQFVGYWHDLFERYGYTTNGDLRLRIWNDDRIENWYRQNLLVATPGGPGPTPLSLIHPVLYDARRAR